MSVHEWSPAAAAVLLGERARRYAAREMAAEEHAAFEIELLASAELQEVLEAELLLRESAPALSAALLDAPPPRRLRPGGMWQLAAALLLALGAGFLGGRFSGDRGSGGSAVDDQALAVVMFTTQRGPAANARTIAAPAGQRFVARVLTGADRNYQLRLLDRRGALLHHWSDVHPTPDGYITVLMPALQQADAPLRVELLGDASPQVFAIELVRH